MVKMEQAQLFLDAMDRKAKMFARSARATFEANRELCGWLLNPLARWAESAYGSDVFDVAARGYAEYCVGVAKAYTDIRARWAATPLRVCRRLCQACMRTKAIWCLTCGPPFSSIRSGHPVVSHIAMFRDDFVRRLPPNATVRELAAGHGVLSLLAAEERPDIQDRRNRYQPSGNGCSKSPASGFRTCGPSQVHGERRAERR